VGGRAVEAARASGGRVPLGGVEPPFGTNQAERLVWEADTVEILARPFLEPSFARQPVPAEQPPGLLAQPSVPSPAQLFGERERPVPPHRPAPKPTATPRLGPDRERAEGAGGPRAPQRSPTRGAGETPR